MKRIITALVAVAIFITTAKAQLHDAQWVISSNVSVLDFRNDTLVNYPIHKWMNIFITSANICDEQGNLLYYTNGIFIADKNGDTVQNGYNISPCSYTQSWDNPGLNIYQAALFLPQPGNSRYYHLFHFSNDALGNSRPGTLYYSVIDKEANFGLGEVTRKNVVFNRGRFRGGGMTACKHANGRDYWIVIGGSDNNSFYKFLLTPDTLLGPFVQSIGPIYALPYDLGHGSFSCDGHKFATVADEGEVVVLDFDRCSGEFSNPVLIHNNVSTQPDITPISGGGGLAFSPNGRFLYVTSRLALNQYDLQAANIQDSVQIYKADSNDYAQMDIIQLAPNGKLFASCWAGGFYFFHTVERPDEKGDSCRFIDTGFVSLTINSSNLPNMINYKLGPLAGSGCDTIATVIAKGEPDNPVRVQPNPANKYFYTEMPLQGNYVFELINQAGQLIDKKETRQVDIFNTENLPNGVYYLKVSDRNNPMLISSQQVVIQH